MAKRASKQMYGYDPSNGIYAGIATAFESPLQPGVFLIPAHCVEESPLDLIAANQTARIVQGVWQAYPDFRGQLAYRADTGAPQPVLFAGSLEEQGLTLTEPPPPTPFEPEQTGPVGNEVLIRLVPSSESIPPEMVIPLEQRLAELSAMFLASVQRIEELEMAERKRSAG